jgi:hypothetical protein
MRQKMKLTRRQATIFTAATVAAWHGAMRMPLNAAPAPGTSKVTADSTLLHADSKVIHANQ